MIISFRDVERLSQLQPGDIVRHKGSDEQFVVTENYDTRVTAVRSVDITNPIEWEVQTTLINFDFDKINV